MQFRKKFRKHLIKCGKSEKNYSRRCGSTNAPSLAIASTFRPVFSESIISSIIIWCNIVPLTLALLRKHPRLWIHLPLKGWNITTKAWFWRILSQVCKANSKFCRLYDKVLVNFISSTRRIPIVNKCMLYEIVFLSLYYTKISYHGRH